MEKSKILIIAFFVLLFLGIMHNIINKSYKTSYKTTSKTVVVKNTPNYRHYGYIPPPPNYNPYKAQYY